MKILDNKETNFTPIFIIANTVMSGCLVILCVMMNGKISKINIKPPTLVELNNGTSTTVIPIGSNDRTPQSISNFVGTTMVSLMSWNALPKTSDNYLAEPTKKPSLDLGVQAGDKKITTSAWASSFALSEDFRESFLKSLADLIPQDVFYGKTQSALIVRHVSTPRQQSEGKWTIDLISNLVILKSLNQVGNGKAIPFNKTIFVRAVDNPTLSAKPTELQKTIYQARKAGLEIYKIQDFDLGK